MRNQKKIPLLLTFLIILSSFAVVYAEEPATKTIYVNPTGDYGNDGLTEATAKQHIQNAIDTAQDNDIIQVSSGTYKENIKIQILI
ncbi:MAG: hypothetical protein PHY59_03915 [Methanobacterium sp.]|nr:hypothetical protein [Methanobacterium sp.]